MSKSEVLQVGDCSFSAIQSLLQRYQIKVTLISSHAKIPGSYWGDSEAGLIANTLYVRPDTPIHSLLHESCHFICMDKQRRELLNTDAEGDYDEENGVCYLQILLADKVHGMGKKRMLQDMDSWGYTFRLGSAKRWFEEDAKDASSWLQNYKIIDKNKLITYKLRQ